MRRLLKFELLLILALVLGGCSGSFLSANSAKKQTNNNLPSKDWNGLFDSDEWVWVNSANAKN